MTIKHSCQQVTPLCTRVGKPAQLLLALIVLSLPSRAWSADNPAFATLNMNPMVQMFGIPALSNQVLGTKGALNVSIEQQAANYHSQSNTLNESLTLDGETWRTNVSASYALSDNADVTIIAPYIRHSAGYMDDLIYDWHDTFGMPQGERTQQTNNQIDLQYRLNGTQIVDIQSPTSGLGDIRFKYVHRLNLSNRALLLQTELKLPTGKFKTLTGSGSTDVSVGLTLNDTMTFQQQDVNVWVGAAATYLSDSESPALTNQDTILWLATTGLGWSLTPSFALKAQFDSQSAAYQSQTIELGDPTLMLTLGGDYYFTNRYRLEIAAVEDIITETSPDIVFSLKLSAAFN